MTRSGRPAYVRDRSTRPSSYHRSTTSTTESSEGEGGVPLPHSHASPHLPPYSPYSQDTSYEPRSSSGHSNFGYGSEDRSSSECGSTSNYVGYGNVPSSMSTSDRSEKTDLSFADTDLAKYRSETPRRAEGVRRTSLSEDEQMLAMAHIGQQLLNPTPRRASRRPGGHTTALPPQHMLSGPGRVVHAQEGEFPSELPIEPSDTVRRCAELLRRQLRSETDVREVLQIWASRGSITARQLLQWGPQSWFVPREDTTVYELRNRSTWGDSETLIGSESDMERYPDGYEGY